MDHWKTPQPLSTDRYPPPVRWRLILGEDPKEEPDSLEDPELETLDESLDLLYNTDRSGDLGESMPRLHRWLGDLRRYFPPTTLHFLQRDAFDRLGIADLLLEPESLANLEPDVHLAGVLLQSFESLNEEQQQAARRIIEHVTRALLARLEPPVWQAVHGALRSRERQRQPPWPRVDWHRTIRANLKHYQPEARTIIPAQRLGVRSGRRQQQELVILVDQSGSMTDSLVYAGLYAAILSRVPALRLTLLAFDTKVLDLSPQLIDPIEVLLGFQLGGGTAIGAALAHARSLIQSPQNTLVVLLSDLYEGGSTTYLIQQIEALQRAGTRLVSLLTLGQDGRPDFNERMAVRLHQLGVPAFACSLDDFPVLMAAALAGRDLPVTGPTPG